MRLTKLGHACVRLEKDGSVLVIDPGAFSGDDALTGANAVLVTHEHFDHIVPDSLRAALAADPGLRVWSTAAVAGQFPDLAARVHAVWDSPADRRCSASSPTRRPGSMWWTMVTPSPRLVSTCTCTARSTRSCTRTFP